MALDTENQNIWSVLFLMTGKGIEELNAKGCNPQHSGKKPKRSHVVTDVEG